MVQRFLDDEEHVLPGLDIDDPVRVDADANQRRGKQVAARHSPDDRTGRAAQNAADEAHRGSTVDEVGTAAMNFVDCTKRQAAGGQGAVDFRQTEWERRQ